eukprot:Em0019g1154a
MAFGYRSSLLDCICGPSDVRSIPREADTFPFSSRRAVLNYLRTDFIEAVHSWGVQKTASPFNRRVTCIEWHPAYHNLLAVSSHGGDIYLWNVDDPSKDVFLEGIGYGYGAITQLKFHPYTPAKVYTTSVDGKFCLRDLEGKRSEVYADTMTFERWWTSLALSANSRDIMFVGGNTGDALVIKFNTPNSVPTCEWLLVTSSNDRTVAALGRQGDGGWWPDQAHAPCHHGSRRLRSTPPTLTRCTESRILTTAQNSELRVYDSYNGWEVPTVVMRHPHKALPAHDPHQGVMAP